MSKNEKRKGQKEAPKNKEELEKNNREMRRRLIGKNEDYSGFLGLPNL